MAKIINPCFKQNLGAMMKWLGYWNTNPEGLGSKSLSGFKVNSASHPPGVHQMITKNYIWFSG